MRFTALLFALITSLSVSAYPSNDLTDRAAAEVTICDQIGKTCKNSEAPLCCDPTGPVGFAHCVKGKVKLTKCKDGCGSEAGVIQCINNPIN